MLVDLATLKANPMRDFTVDPIDPDIVANLKASIQEHGFWGGVVCRQCPDGTIEIGAGHHRIQAALEAGITAADLFVRTDDVDDAEMVLLYATENGTQRGNTSTALAGTIASAIRFLTKMHLTETDHEFMIRNSNSSRGSKSRHIGNIESGEGVGQRHVYAFLQGIPGITLNAVGDQLANLKASGDLARIHAVVEAEIAEEEREAFAAVEEAERERQRLLQEELDAQAKRVQAEKEQQEAQERAAAAREVEERARREAIAKASEVYRKEADARAQIAEKRRQEAEQKQREFEALRQKKSAARASAAKASTKAAERPRTFDFEGVAKHLKNAHQLDVFREIVTSPGVQPSLPVSQQAGLAADLIAAAEEESKITNKHVEVTGAFIRERVIKLLLQGKDTARAEAKAEHEALIRADIVQRAEYYMNLFVRNAYGMASVGKKLADLCKDWPDDVSFPASEEFSRVFTNVRQIMYDIDQALQAHRR